MSVRYTPRSNVAESPEIRALIDAAKLSERDGRWSEASVRYEALVRNPFASDHTRLSALRWLGRAYLEQGNRGAAIDVLEAAVAAATQAGSPSAIAQALNVVAIVHQTGGDLDRAESMGIDKRAVIDSLGPAGPAVWLAWQPATRGTARTRGQNASSQRLMPR